MKEAFSVNAEQVQLVAYSPERCLVVEMVQQALRDLSIPSYSGHARQWLGSPSEGPGSFRRCATVLGFDPDRALIALGMPELVRERGL